MKQTTNALLLFLSALFFFSSCKKEVLPSATEAKLIFQFKFDSTQVRLNNVGQPAGLPAGNAGQSPVFNKMSAHYIELAPSVVTALGAGEILYKAEETMAGGSKAIDFERSTPVDTTKGHWQIDERNGIIIDQYFIGNRFTSAFTVQTTTIVDSYWREGDKLIAEFYGLTAKPVTTSGNGTDDSPKVDSYETKSYQKAVMKRKK